MAGRTRSCDSTLTVGSELEEADTRKNDLPRCMGMSHERVEDWIFCFQPVQCEKGVHVRTRSLSAYLINLVWPRQRP
jgi:hypothetical protein